MTSRYRCLETCNMFTHMEFDDFIPEYYQRSIESHMLGSQMWGFNDNISGVPKASYALPEELTVSENQYGFGSTIYSNANDGRRAEKDLAFMLMPMVNKVREIFPFRLDLIRIRGGLSTKDSRGGINLPHTDWEFPHYTFLYYANDSDGDTILFNEMRDVRNKSEHQHDEFTIKKRIMPKRGRAIIFNGLYYHSSSQPQYHDSRIVINMNFVPSKER